MTQKRLFISPHRIGFPTARRIRDQIPGTTIIKCRGSRFNWNRRGGVVVNWGRSDLPPTNRKVINPPSAIRKASNKRTFLSLCEQNGIPAPRLLTDTQCREALGREETLFIRTPSSFGGRGIEIVRSLDEFRGIPGGHIAVVVYPKKTEYRAHVWGDDVIFLTQKRRKRGVERTPDQKLIWSHSNGYVHCRQDVECPEGLEDTAVAAVKACGLDFGAVDILLTPEEEVLVLEVNTAPGLTGQVLDKYLEVLRNV